MIVAFQKEIDKSAIVLFRMQRCFVLILFLSISIIIYPTKAKAASKTRSKKDHEPAPNAEIDGEIATVLDDAIRLADAESEVLHDSLIPNSDSKSKLQHELQHNADGVGRMRRSCGGGGGCGCGGCGCGGGCGCCQRSCCSSTCTTCTTTTTLVFFQDF